MQLPDFCISLGTDNRPEEISLQRSIVGTPLLSFAFLAVLFLWHKWCDTAFLHILQFSGMCKSPCRQNRNIYPCTGNDCAAGFERRTHFLRHLINYHLLMRKNTFSSCKEKWAAGSLGRRQKMKAGLRPAEGIQLAFLPMVLSTGC